LRGMPKPARSRTPRPAVGKGNPAQHSRGKGDESARSLLKPTVDSIKRGGELKGKGKEGKQCSKGAQKDVKGGT